MTPSSVTVNATRRGGWEVSCPESDFRIRCETLDDARRLARRCAARTSPCDLVVHDAYNRVVEHELIRSTSHQAERGE